MLTAEKSSNDSAQSPAWSRKARPPATSARASVRPRASPAKTSGGNPWICFSARSSAPSSGQSGCWSAGRPRQDDGDQGSGFTSTGLLVSAPCAKQIRAARVRVAPIVERSERSQPKRSGGWRRRDVMARLPSAWGVCARRRAMTPARRGNQAARMRAASSRRPVTARLTSRRAASAVTPSSSPTSR